MSVQNALFSGVSGLSTYSSAISVIGNNIANVNTPGFKEGRLHFSDIVAQGGSDGGLQMGRGTRAIAAETVFSQGGFQSTARNGDLAIDGEGFFVVKEPNTNNIFYTRTGNFTVNKDGRLVNSQGMALQGFDIDSNGNALRFISDVNVRPSTGDVDISGRAYPPKITENATIELNLDSESSVLMDSNTGLPITFDPSDPVGTSNASTAMTIFDSIGNSHTAELYFQKTGENAWNWMITMAGSDLTGAGIAASDHYVVAQGEMTFTAEGQLDTLTTTQRIDYTTGALTALAQPEQGVSASFDFSGGGQAGQVTAFDFGVPGQIFDSASGAFIANPAAGTSPGGSTQFALPSATLFQTQDGYGSGVLESFSIDPQGTVKGLFSNGQTLDLMQVALARFSSPEGLTPVGQNLFSQSFSSGEPIVDAPTSGGLGSIVSNALEISNVDLATQFVELIRAQQAFQANARVITTGDDLLTEVVNLRR